MIHKLTRLIVADNSGAKIATCIGMLGQSKVARVGTVVIVSIKTIAPFAKVRRGTIHKAVVIRTRKEFSRKDGRCVKFDSNDIVLLNPDMKSTIGSRVHGPVPVELADKWSKIITLAERVI